MNNAPNTKLNQSRLLFVVNDLSFLISHRLPVALRAADAGYEIHIAAPEKFEAAQELNNIGFRVHTLNVHPYRTNPFVETRSILEIYRLFKKLRPDVVHLVTIKPVLYGGIAARLAAVPCVVMAISGLGSVFTSTNLKNRVLSLISKQLYRLALGHPNQRVIFQNDHDRALVGSFASGLKGKSRMIRGSGVDLNTFQPTPEPKGPVTFLFAARLLREKGIVEFVEAARILKREGHAARFVVAGDRPDGNPASVPQDILNEWRTEGVIELWGHQSNMPDVFRQVNVVVLPSYYGEGLPKVLIEGAACGRSVITTDWPGCRDAVIDRETGFLVPVRDSHALANSMRDMILSSESRRRMGTAGRKLAERKFSIEQCVRNHMDIYQELIPPRLFRK